MSCGAAAAALGIFLLIQYASGIDLGLDELFMAAWDTAGNTRPGRMAPQTALCFVLTGIAIVFMSFRTQPRVRPIFCWD